jgi:hypothetical protein
MASLASLGVLDLSTVTQTLLGMLGTYMNSTAPIPMSIIPSGSMPDVLRTESGPQLTFSLFHVVEDKFQRNNPFLISGTQPFPRARSIPYQPMSLDLYYLLSAFSQKNWEQEQQAMSLAMQFFYQNPIVTMPVTLPGIPGTVSEEFTLTMQIETSDEMARLWQAITVPLRLSVVYKVSVILLTPPAAPAPAPQVQPQGVSLIADPTQLPYSQSGQLLGAVWTATFPSLTSSAAAPDTLSIDYSPAVVPYGQRFFLYGANLNTPTSSNVFLLMPDGVTEFDVTSWRSADPQLQTSSRITLDMRNTIGAPPGQAPPPGIYQLRAGSLGPSANRTNSVPFSISAWIDTSSVPSPNPPILLPDGTGTYTLKGEGFLLGQTETLLDTYALVNNQTAPLLDGQFALSPTTQATFRHPAGLAGGVYAVRVRVNGVESPPSWWISV